MFFKLSVCVVLDRCMLHNFAGNIEMYGILDAVASGPIEARTSVNSTMASYSFLMTDSILYLVSPLNYNY